MAAAKEVNEKVKVMVSYLCIKSAPNCCAETNKVLQDFPEVDIVEKQNGYGKLESGDGWINLKYTEKVSH